MYILFCKTVTEDSDTAAAYSAHSDHFYCTKYSAVSFFSFQMLYIHCYLLTSIIVFVLLSWISDSAICLHISWHMSHWIPRDVLMNAAVMGNVFTVLCEYLYCEPGDPLAAGLSKWTVSICTVRHTGYMAVQISLDIHWYLFFLLLILPGGTKSSLWPSLP